MEESTHLQLNVHAHMHAHGGVTTESSTHSVMSQEGDRGEERALSAEDASCDAAEGSAPDTDLFSVLHAPHLQAACTKLNTIRCSAAPPRMCLFGRDLVHVCTRARACVCVCVCAYLRAFFCVFVCVCFVPGHGPGAYDVYIYDSVSMYVWVCLRMCMCVCMCVV